MHNKALQAKPGNNIPVNHIVEAALQQDEEGKRVYASIKVLGDREEAWLPNTPEHTLCTHRIMQGRQADIDILSTVNTTVMTSAQWLDLAHAGDEQARQQLYEQYMDTFDAIDQIKASVSDKQQARSMLYEQVKEITEHKDFANQILKEAEASHLEAHAEAILVRFYDVQTGQQLENS